LMRKAISNVLFDESLPAAALVMTLGPMSQKTAGFPIGGSLEFSRTIEKRFLDLGGKVTYRTKVAKIVQRNGRAVGVQLADGSEVPADYVIAASDMRAALYSLLESTEIDPIHKLLLDEGKLYPPSILVTFGVDHVFPQEISCLGTTYELQQPITVAGQKKKFFGVKNFNYDPSLSPEGKSIVGTVFATYWDFWEKLKGKDQDYQSAQEHIVKTCMEQIEKHFPGFSSRIEMVDIATPITMERYTGNWKGTYMTWILSGEFQRKYRYIPKTVPGLEGFYLASMWTNPPGGVPGAASAGRGVIQLICSKDHQRFTTSTP
jgi:phytoene dehydrogenase-like protein